MFPASSRPLCMEMGRGRSDAECGLRDAARCLPCPQRGGSIAKDDTPMKGATVPDNRSSMGAGSNGRRHLGFHRVGLLLLPNRLPQPVNPALLRHTEERAESAQNQVADHITAFSGSMLFVYIHILWFGCWIGLRRGGVSVRAADDDRLA
jgi:hypothetical protein